ncbi:MAG: hypothetical protein FJW30_04625 [Acidobacteria bacterium]|nr:hypothetical protein [Acidobacteriota bacterium]
MNWRMIPVGFLKQYWAERGRAVAAPARMVDARQWPDSGIHAAWLGHSTVLMKVDGVTILTDPVFSTYAGLGFGPITIGVKRLIDTPLALEAVPKIDLVVLSHAHMDHLDVPSLRALESKSTRVVTARATADLLRANRYASVHEMGWGETLEAGPVTVTALEVNHWGARMRTDTYRGYNGYTLRVGRRRILFAGDTANTQSFRDVGGADVAIFPIGAYNPWIRYHCNPEQAWRMVNEARAEVVLPVHHKTFRLSNEPANEPLDRLHSAVGAAVQRIGWGEVGDSFRWS